MKEKILWVYLSTYQLLELEFYIFTKSEKLSDTEMTKPEKNNSKNGLMMWGLISSDVKMIWHNFCVRCNFIDIVELLL